MNSMDKHIVNNGKLESRRRDGGTERKELDDTEGEISSTAVGTAKKYGKVSFD